MHPIHVNNCGPGANSPSDSRQSSTESVLPECCIKPDATFVTTWVVLVFCSYRGCSAAGATWSRTTEWPPNHPHPPVCAHTHPAWESSDAEPAGAPLWHSSLWQQLGVSPIHLITLYRRTYHHFPRKTLLRTESMLQRLNKGHFWNTNPEFKTSNFIDIKSKWSLQTTWSATIFCFFSIYVIFGFWQTALCFKVSKRKHARVSYQEMAYTYGGL